MLPWLALQLKLRGLQNENGWAKFACPDQKERASSADEMRRAKEIAVAINMVAGRWPGNSRCLLGSLLLEKYLSKQNIPCQIVIGVQKSHCPVNGFGAHAWVECNGQVINDRPDVIAGFSPFHGRVSPGSCE